MKQKYLTLVFNTEHLADWEIKSLLSQNVDLLKHMAWGHISYQRDDLLKALQAFVDACDSGADPEENFLDEYLQALDIISKVKRE
jgi:hypothetical protein